MPLYKESNVHLTFCVPPQLKRDVHAYIHAEGSSISGFGILLFTQLLEGKFRVNRPSDLKYKHLTSEVHDEGQDFKKARKTKKKSRD